MGPVLRIFVAALVAFGAALGAAHGGEGTRAFGYDEWSRIVREKGLDPEVIVQAMEKLDMRYPPAPEGLEDIVID